MRRPLKEKKGLSPEYNNVLRMGLAEFNCLYKMSLVPETNYSLYLDIVLVLVLDSFC